MHVGVPFMYSVASLAVEAWWKFGRHSELHRCTGQPHDPWKQGFPAALRTVPGANCPLRIRTDLAHCWPIGTGKDFAASSILLLTHLGAFEGRSTNARLEHAWYCFQGWRRVQKKRCKLVEFSLRAFKVQSLLDFNRNAFFVRVLLVPIMALCFTTLPNQRG